MTLSESSAICFVLVVRAEHHTQQDNRDEHDDPKDDVQVHRRLAPLSTGGHPLYSSDFSE